MPEDTRGNTVDQRSDWLQSDDKDHELAEALRLGVPAMRRAAKRWKWMKPNEGELEIVPLGQDQWDGPPQYEGIGQVSTSDGEYTVYDLRVSRSTMPNVWADSIRATARLPFRSRVVTKGWDVDLVGESIVNDEGELVSRERGWVDDLDGEGRSLDEWAAEAFEHSLFEGICYAFVDNDPRSFPDPESRRRAGGRPYCTMLRRRDIRWLVLEVGPGNTPRVKAIAFDQPIRTVDVSDPNAWRDDTTPAIKIVIAGDEILDPETGRRVGTTPVTTQVWEETDSGDYVEDETRRAKILPENPQDTLIDVPLVPLYGTRVSPFRGRSPYLDTATMQESVWNQCSELDQKARQIAHAWIHESGVPAQEPGASQPVDRANPNLRYRASTDPRAKMEFVEPGAESLAELRRLIEWKLEQILASHNQLRSERPSAPVTAREITLEGVQASSALEMMVIFAESGWQRILELMALLGGLPELGSVEIPHDFGLPNTGLSRNHQLFMTGKMTAKNYWREAQRAGDVHETEFDMEAEIDLEEAGRELEAMEAAEAIGEAIKYGASEEANRVTRGESAAELPEDEGEGDGS